MCPTSTGKRRAVRTTEYAAATTVIRNRIGLLRRPLKYHRNFYFFWWRNYCRGETRSALACERAGTKGDRDAAVCSGGRGGGQSGDTSTEQSYYHRAKLLLILLYVRHGIFIRLDPRKIQIHHTRKSKRFYACYHCLRSYISSLSITLTSRTGDN